MQFLIDSPVFQYPKNPFTSTSGAARLPSFNFLLLSFSVNDWNCRYRYVNAESGPNTKHIRTEEDSRYEEI